jgi:hypothetical protein
MGLALEPHGFHYKTIPHIRSTSLISFWRVGNLQFKLDILHSCLWIHHHTKGFDSLLTFHLWVVATFTTPNFSTLPSALAQAKLQDVERFQPQSHPYFMDMRMCTFIQKTPIPPVPSLSFPPSILFLNYECQWGIRMTRGSQGPIVKVGALIVRKYSWPPPPPPPNPPTLIPKNKNKALDREIRQWVLSTLTTCHIGIKGKYKYLNPTWPYYILTLHKSSHALHL